MGTSECAPSTFVAARFIGLSTSVGEQSGSSRDCWRSTPEGRARVTVFPSDLYFPYMRDRRVFSRTYPPLLSLSLRESQMFAMFSTYLDVALLSHPILAFLTIQNPKMRSKPSNLQYVAFSFLSLLFLRYASSTYFGIPDQIVMDVCTSMDQPNPIASLYPNNATGTLNGTVAVLPISLELARQLIPPQYRILEHAYRALLPSFPQGMYPAIVQALHDHEVQAFGYKIDDFTVS